MHIHVPHNDPNLRTHDTLRPDQGHASQSASAPKGTHSSSEGPDSGRVAAPELMRLAEKLRLEPEVREEVIRNIIERLSNGELLSRDAAVRTAGAILGE